MRFWKKRGDAETSLNEVKKAEMLEAYTCWLKNERMSRKQKRLLREINAFPELQPLKQLIDFSHYHFEESERVSPPPGAEDRAVARVMAEMQGDTAETDTPAWLHAGELTPQPAYSPQGMGNELTKIMQTDGAIPDAKALEQWEAQQTPEPPETQKRYDAIRTLARLHLRFEQKDGDVSVTDLGGSDATYVDGAPVDAPTLLKDGTTLKCGKIRLKVLNIERS